MRHVIVGAVLAAGIACARPAPPNLLEGTFLDLSHPFDDKTIFWPTAAPFRLEKVAEGMTDQGYYYAANQFFTAEHGGTHLDAPIHFAKGRHTVDEIPIEQLIGHGVLIDVGPKCTADPDYRIQTSDLEDWERQHGRIPDGAIVLLRTGYSRHWPDAATYLGTAERGADAVPKLHFPGLHPDAARWLLQNRIVKAIGLDTASIDYGQSTLFETHRVLMERNTPAFENLDGLERLPPTGFWVFALPMKIAGGSGAPLRAVVVIPPS